MNLVYSRRLPLFPFWYMLLTGTALGLGGAPIWGMLMLGTLRLFPMFMAIFVTGTLKPRSGIDR